jgi:cytidine deaminase
MALDLRMEKRMIQAAKKAGRKAYCPYSKFPVGAAVLDARGEIFTGCNVENASSGLTICAERNAVFRMAAGGGRRIAAVVIYTPTKIPSAPCGACRQVIHEFGPDAWIISACRSSEILRERLSTLLPHAFGPENVKNRGGT